MSEFVEIGEIILRRSLIASVEESDSRLVKVTFTDGTFGKFFDKYKVVRDKLIGKEDSK